MALVTVLQVAEGLTDRQAADAVRARIDWKYALGLELSDPGFDHTVLTGFRQRLIEHGLEENRAWSRRRAPCVPDWNVATIPRGPFRLVRADGRGGPDRAELPRAEPDFDYDGESGSPRPLSRELIGWSDDGDGSS
ncbi:transposase [Actinosynnema sp. NPDC002837]